MIDERRSALATTGDSRAVDTRGRLAGAFHLAVDQQIPDITVVQICKLAGVGRSTFYTHFATVEDLAVSAIGDLFDDVSPIQVSRRQQRKLSRPDITRLGLEQLVDNLWRGRGVVKYAMSLPSGPAIRQHIVAHLATSARATVLAEQPDLTEIELSLTTNFLAGAIIQIFMTWLEEPQVHREQLIELMLSLLPPWMTGAPTSGPSVLRSLTDSL